MENENSWLGSYVDALQDLIRAGADYLPNLLGAVLFLVLGFVVARLARHAIKRIAKAANRFLERSFPIGILAEARVSDMAAVLLGEIVFWVILLVTVTIAAGIAGLSAIAEWLDRITAQLPNLLAGITIVVVGYFLSVYVREQIAPKGGSGGTRQNRLLERFAQGLILSTALIVGLDQVGIDVALLVALSVVSVAALLIGLAVAFALGARSHVSNLVGVRSARRHLSAGVRVRIDDIEGEVLEVTSTQITLTTDQGKVLLPGRFLDEKIITIIAADIVEGAGHD
jgi:hypothetical protein